MPSNSTQTAEPPHEPAALACNRLIGARHCRIRDLFALDQWVIRTWMVGPLQLRRARSLCDRPPALLRPALDARTRGVSMGMFEATSAWRSRWILVARDCAVIALVVTIWMFREKACSATSSACRMILGGALGNIKSIATELGYVIDYADFHIGDFRPFLIFNIADAAITIGVLIILARSPSSVRDKDDRRGRRPHGQSKSAETPNGDASNLTSFDPFRLILAAGASMLAACGGGGIPQPRPSRRIRGPAPGSAGRPARFQPRARQLPARLASWWKAPRPSRLSKRSSVAPLRVAAVETSVLDRAGSSRSRAFVPRSVGDAETNVPSPRAA